MHFKDTQVVGHDSPYRPALQGGRSCTTPCYYHYPVEWSLKLVDVKDDGLCQGSKPLKEELELWPRSPIYWIHELIITQRASIKHYQVAILSPALRLLLPAAGANWTPFDLGVYVTSCTYGKLEIWLVRQAFSILRG